MTVNENTVKFIAELANFRIENEDIPGLVTGMETILEMAASMNEAKTNNVLPMLNPLDATQILREDKAEELKQKDKFSNIAPATLEGLYLVPKVVE